MPHERTRPRLALLINLLDCAYQLSFRNAIARAAKRQDADLLVCIGRELEHANATERTLNVIYDWVGSESVDGAIVLSAALANFVGSEGVARLSDGVGVPTVSVGLQLPGVPSIVFDNRRAMRAAVEHLVVQHQASRIVYLGGPSHNQEARERLLGYTDALEYAGLGFDPALVANGGFTSFTGREAMLEVLTRDQGFDAVVAANDYMALGALDVLIEHGFEVPDEVRLVGFDDSPVARFAPRSLTSVAQPIDEMAERAVADLLLLLRGGQPTPHHLEVHLAQRESCGCGYVLSKNSHSSPVQSLRAVEYVHDHQAELAARLLDQSGASRQLWSSFVERMLEALVQELAGTPGAFLRAMAEIANRAIEREGSLDDVGRAVVQLRRECRRAGLYGPKHVALEEACLRALTELAGTSTRREGRRALDILDHASGLRHVSQQLSVALEPHALGTQVHAALSQMGVEQAFVALIDPEAPQRFRVFCAIEDGQPIALGTETYPVGELLPREFPKGDEPVSLMLLPLTFERDVLGMVALSGETDPFACELLRGQLSASLKLGLLHSRVVQETALRERLAHQQLLGEMAIARRIQTALAPKAPQVPGLEIAASMLSADQVGGDYYDVLPVADGAWLGVGDVTGHGLLAGLVMLMIQSSVAALVAIKPDANPSELVCRLNDVLRPNVRERLGADEHATFVLLRYRSDGRLSFAGAHEDVIVCRNRSRKCESVQTDGMWLGILDDISAATRDTTLELEPGDVLILHTDGIVEARNVKGEMFGLERLMGLVEGTFELGVQAIHDTVLEAARTWSPLLQDDMTLVVVRRA